MRRRAAAFLHDRIGATGIEYALLLGLIAIVAIIGFGNFSAAFDGLMNYVTQSTSNAIESVDGSGG